jgi:signal transduction histidine kinase
MAEVATGVLHNVGNVLNSVNVSANVVANTLRQSEVSSLIRVGEMITAHEQDLAAFLTSDERGKVVPRFIADLAQCMSEEQSLMLKELLNLSRGIEHIKQTVSAQQWLAKKGSVLTAIDPVRLMETALTMQGGAMARHEIEIVREFQSLPEIQLDTHKVLQILINLIGNAKQAAKAGQNTPRQIKLVVAATRGDQGKVVRFGVIDNGVGIAPENLTRIFGHGFTTKPEGHGFGLHSSANAARELGGLLTATSEGLGRGAAFTLELPIEVNQEQPCSL